MARHALTLGLLCLALLGKAVAEPSVWEARHPDLPGTLLMTGSIHVLRAEDLPLPAVFDNLYEQAERVVLEMDMDDLDTTAIQDTLVRAALLPAAATLDDVIPADLLDAATRAAAELGVPLALLNRFEPWFIALTLSNFGLSQAGYRPEYGIEQHLLTRALRDSREVIGLEMLATQVAVFDSLSPAEQQELLAQTLRELARSDAAMGELVRHWRNGELAELGAALMADFDDFPDLYQRLVTDRNSAWAATLREVAALPGPSLIVVGALHYLGNDSLLVLLETAGFEVQRLQ